MTWPHLTTSAITQSVSTSALNSPTSTSICSRMKCARATNTDGTPSTTKTLQLIQSRTNRWLPELKASSWQQLKIPNLRVPQSLMITNWTMDHGHQMNKISSSKLCSCTARTGIWYRSILERETSRESELMLRNCSRNSSVFLITRKFEWTYP